MKLTNVKYCYRRDLDRWLIIFPTHAEAKAFEGFYSDGKYKPQFCTYMKTVTETTRYRAIYAQLTGRFEQLRQLYRAKGMRDTIVDDLESDGTFDKIDLIFDTERGFATFRIERFETWTDWACKSILNSQFGMVARANGYSDTDDAYQGGLCTRRNCCGIGIGEHRSRYGNTEERIIFTIKNFCRGEADIIKVSAWTKTFIGTNKENEKEYSWVDFKQYMQKLSATGSDIWDIEYEYDETCPMTGTEVADKLHVYLKPLAYKRLFEKGKKVWISTGSLLSNDDYLGRVKALTPPPVPYWAKFDDDGKIGFRQKDKDEVQKEIDEMTKRIYEKLDIKQVKDFDTDTAWHEYLTATEMAKLGADFDGDTVCEYCKRDVDICKEAIAATLKAKNSTAEPHIFFNNKVMTLTEFNAFIKDTNNKEEKNMGPKDTTFSEFCRRLYWGTITPVKPTKILIQGTATIIWWSDGMKTVVKCQKGDKMDPEKGIAMCVMKKFMGTNETHSNYLDFAKDAIAKYEKQQAAEKAKKKAEADKRRRAAAKKKGTAENTNYKKTTKKHPIETLSDARDAYDEAMTALTKETNTNKEKS